MTGRRKIDMGMQEDRNNKMSIAQIARKHHVTMDTVKEHTEDPLYYEWDYWRWVILDACGRGRTDDR